MVSEALTFRGDFGSVLLIPSLFAGNIIKYGFRFPKVLFSASVKDSIVILADSKSLLSFKSEHDILPPVG